MTGAEDQAQSSSEQLSPPKPQRQGRRLTSQQASDMGKKGGGTLRDERGPEYFSQIGKKGARALRENRGEDYYSEIGKKGGERVRDSHDAGYYARIGRKGGQANRRERQH